MDNFSAPRFDLLFRPQEYTPKPNEDANFMGNIAALQDPSGTLARKQAELVAKNMAQVKTDDIRGEFQKFALDEIQRNLDDELKMYQSNKGFNRLALGGDQLLTKQKRDKELIGKVGALRQLSNDYQSTMEEVGKDVAKGIITPEDYAAFDADMNARIKAAGGIGDIPSARQMYNTYLSKYASQDWLKKLDEYMKIPMEQGSKRSTDVLDPKTGKYVSVYDYDGVTDAMPLVELYPQIKRGLEIKFGGDEQAMRKFLGDRYGLKGAKLVPGQMNNNVTVNTGDGSGGSKGRTIIPFVNSSGKIKTDVKGNNRVTHTSEVAKEMPLGSFSNQLPWKGKLKNKDGVDTEVNGNIVSIVVDKSGNVWTKVQGKVADSKNNNFWGLPDMSEDAEGNTVFTRYVAFTPDIKDALEREKIDIRELNTLWGKPDRQTNAKAKYPLPKGKPSTVEQNGYTYTWNESTGQYE